MSTLKVSREKDDKPFECKFWFTLISDSRQHIVESEINIYGVIGSPIVVPCLPTSKDLKVTLVDTNDNVSRI